MTAIDLLLTCGSGPAECRIALMELVRIIQADAGRRGCLVDTTYGPAPDQHGAKSALLSLEGDLSSALAADYVGTVRFVFDSPVRPEHKRRNWFVGVQPVELAAIAVPTVRPADVRFETLRAGGPGGQHQNTTDSAVRALHVPTGTVVTVRSERSQHRNKALALQRLEAALAISAGREEEAMKSGLFKAAKTLERGNEVKLFRL